MSQPIVTESDRPQIEYKAFSLGAVAALLVSLLGLLGFTTPLLWVVPLLGAVLAVRSLYAIKQDDSLLGGRVAIVGLVISLFVLSCAPAFYFSRRATLFAQARAHADDWLATLQAGRRHEAYELTLAYEKRQPMETDLVEFYARVPNSEETGTTGSMDQIDYPGRGLAMFLEAPLPAAIVAQGDACEIRFVGNDSLTTQKANTRDNVVLDYEATYELEGSRETAPFTIELERKKYLDIGESHWRVVEVIFSNKMPRRMKK